MFVKAADEAKSVDPLKVAAKLDGMKVDASTTAATASCEADDHQFFQPMYIASFGPLDQGPAVRRGEHRLGLEERGKIDTPDTMVLPTSCKMNRPS